MIYLMMLETEQERVSFGTLYEETYRKLLFVARGILHSEEDAEEVVQDVYVKWAKNYRNYQKKTIQEMTRLGVVMTRNLCIDRIRQRKRHPVIPIEIDDDRMGESEMDDGGEDILEGIVTRERVDALVQAMRALDAGDQLLLALRYDQEFSYKRIAEEMDLTVQNVKMRLYRVKKRLREVLGDE